MNVSFIGSGNLAWHLAQALDNTDFPVREVFSLNPGNANALVDRLYQATVVRSLDFSNSSSRVFVIAVPDDAIPEVVEKIRLPGQAILLHTAGSQPLSVLEDAPTRSIGVFYPLQTFSKNRKLDFSEIPVFVEGDSGETTKILTSMGRAISRRVHPLSSEKRLALHVAAVFASNFANHMFALASDIVGSAKLDFEVLKPLIAEMANKAIANGPASSQTGPARRGDLRTLDSHMAFLKDDEGIAEIYRVISQHIVDRYA